MTSVGRSVTGVAVSSSECCNALPRVGDRVAAGQRATPTCRCRRGRLGDRRGPTLDDEGRAGALRCGEPSCAPGGGEERCAGLLGARTTAARELDARERGETPTNLKRLVEQLWLAEKAVEVICSDALRDQLIAHARSLHRVVRDAVMYPDWWACCALLQEALLAQIKVELHPNHDF